MGVFVQAGIEVGVGVGSPGARDCVVRDQL